MVWCFILLLRHFSPLIRSQEITGGCVIVEILEHEGGGHFSGVQLFINRCRFNMRMITQIMFLSFALKTFISQVCKLFISFTVKFRLEVKQNYNPIAT